MIRIAWLGLLLPLVACAGQLPAPSVTAASSPAACRVGPDGARPIVERGTGGTGGAATRLTERGIGGTGGHAIHGPQDLHLKMRSAERGIGGTGIIGVVTGFGSLCVAGERVALPDDTELRVDDRPGDLDVLRAGQVTAVRTEIVAGGLSARAIDVIHLVVGPVEAVKPGSMQVAGQQVLLEGASGSAVAAKPGTWVAVSGLRQPGGAIAATRIDQAAKGLVLVRGELTQVAGATLIGGLGVRHSGASRLPAGWSVVAVGRLQNGILLVDQIRLDRVTNDPAEYFGPSISSYVVEGYVTPVPGGILVNRTFVAGTDLGVSGLAGRRIVAFQRAANGRLHIIDQLPATRSEPSRGELFTVPPSELTLSPGAVGAGDGDDAPHPAPARKH